MRPDQWVAIVGTLFCLGTIAAVRWGHPSTWCAWVDSWTRSDEVPSREDVARALVSHALQTGTSQALGWRVDRVRDDLWVVTGGGRSTAHTTPYSAELRLLREL